MKKLKNVTYKKKRKLYRCYKFYVQVIYKNRYSHTVSCFQRGITRTPITLWQLERHLNDEDVSLPLGGVVEVHRVVGTSDVLVVWRDVLCVMQVVRVGRNDVNFRDSFSCSCP